MAKLFDRSMPLGDALLEWWTDLQQNRGRRGDRAELRRAWSITAIAKSEPYQRFYRRLLREKWPFDGSIERNIAKNDRLAAIAGVLAHIESEDRRCSFSSAASKEAGEGAADRPPISPLRFTRLLESPDVDALFSGLRRALPLVKTPFDVVGLANDIFYWDDNDDAKKRWAYGYDWPEK